MRCIVRINSVFSWGGKYSFIYNLSFGLPKGLFFNFFFPYNDITVAFYMK